MSTVTHNAGQIMRYIEHVIPKSEKAGGVMDLPPMNRKAKGESTPPVPEGYLDVMDANTQAGHYFRSLLEEARRGGKSYGGRDYGAMLSDVIYSPAILRSDIYRQVAWRMCMHIAQVMHSRFGEARIFVYVNPEDEEARPKTRAARDRERTMDARHSYRKIAEDVRRIEREENATREAAKELKASREGCSVSKVEKALNFDKRERENAEEVNREWEERARQGRVWAS